MLDFQRMEKLEFGGLKGRFYSERAAQMYKEFSNRCQVLKHSENSPLDLNSQVKSTLIHVKCVFCSSEIWDELCYSFLLTVELLIFFTRILKMSMRISKCGLQNLKAVLLA